MSKKKDTGKAKTAAKSTTDRAKELKRIRDAKYRAKKRAAKANAKPVTPAPKNVKEGKTITRSKLITFGPAEGFKVPKQLMKVYEDAMSIIMENVGETCGKVISHILCTFETALREYVAERKAVAAKKGAK